LNLVIIPHWRWYTISLSIRVIVNNKTIQFKSSSIPHSSWMSSLLPIKVHKKHLFRNTNNILLVLECQFFMWKHPCWRSSSIFTFAITISITFELVVVSWYLDLTLFIMNSPLPYVCVCVCRKHHWYFLMFHFNHVFL